MPPRRYTLRSTGPARPSRLSLDRELNEAQRRAVETEAPRVLILAGAGSGKTRTMVFRVARLVEKGTPPRAIVLVTFTNRAAREMTSRIDRLLGASAREVRAGTFHGLAHAALRRHGVPGRPGGGRGFGIIDREDQTRVMASAISDLEIDVRARRFPTAELLTSVGSLALNAGTAPVALLTRRFPSFADLLPELERVFARYAARKQEMNVLDFDDLLVEWKHLLSSEPRGAALAAEVEHVLVDEFQDTNPLQAELGELLASASGNLCVVGDDAQSIYSFRGAAFENILDFPRRAPTEVHRLETSYRSTPQILELANAAIEKNPLQFPKSLVAARGPGVAPVVVAAREPAQQGEFIAQRVLELRDEGVPLSAQAVLYRAHSHSAELQLELARRDIPFVLRSGVRFLEQAHVKDALSFLRVVANPLDELAWRRVLDVVPGVGPKTAARVFEHVRARVRAGADPWADLAGPEVASSVPSRAAEPFHALARLVAHLASAELDGRPGAMLGVLASPPERPTSGGREPTLARVFLDHLENVYPSAATRREELGQLAGMAASHAELDTFLAELVLDGELASDSGQGGATEERLTLSTVHQAKGLEWRVVFVAGLADGAFPIQTALEEPGGEAEERRLFYVAITRAMEQLYLTYPASRFVRDDERALMRPSRFLQELQARPGLYERWVLETG